MWTFHSATPAYWPQIAGLLTSANLPLDGAEDHLDGFLLAFGGTILVGTACLEYYGTAALLRSVAVAESARAQGLGQELVRRMIERARSDGIHSIVLLTTSAAEFFPRFGFRPIARAEVPAAAQQSIEFRSVCPASAQAMLLSLSPPARQSTIKSG